MIAFAATRFLYWTIATYVLVFAVSLTWPLVFDTKIPGSPAIAIVLGPPWGTGTSWYARFLKVPSKPIAWQCAFLFTIIGVGIACAVFALQIRYSSVFSEQIISLGDGFLIWVASLFSILVLFLNRFFFRFGAEQSFKIAQKKAGTN